MQSCSERALQPTPPHRAEPRTSVRETDSAEQTEALGAELAGRLHAGDVVLLRGELGSGKTTIARGIARALGVRGPVTSPTFTIGHRYQGDRAVVSHIDLYRLAALGAEEPGLLEDYFVDGEIALVEWPPDAAWELPRATLVVTLAHRGGEHRRVEIEDLR
jgi:tRNA threonylcarbamoyladenosine biosynthesis protein TsaE